MLDPLAFAMENNDPEFRSPSHCVASRSHSRHCWQRRKIFLRFPAIEMHLHHTHYSIGPRSHFSRTPWAYTYISPRCIISFRLDAEYPDKYVFVSWRPLLSPRLHTCIFYIAQTYFFLYTKPRHTSGIEDAPPSFSSRPLQTCLPWFLLGCASYIF
jgi:hypothetical protein